MSRSYKGATKILLSELTKQLDFYNLDCGQYPTEEEGLTALYIAPNSCPNWGPEPYRRARVKESIIKYVCDPREIERLQIKHEQGLLSMTETLNFWHSCFKEVKIPKEENWPQDLWFNRIVYTSIDNGKHYVLTGLGRNGTVGGEGLDADISSLDE